MGNEFNGEDFAPHTVPRIVYNRVYAIDGSADDTVQKVIVEGGYHPKMRLRYAHAIVANEALMFASTQAKMSVLHGSDEVVTDFEPTDNDVVGTLDELDIVDEYKDAAEGDQVALYCSVKGLEGGSEQGDLLVHLEYELIA